MIENVLTARQERNEDIGVFASRLRTLERKALLTFRSAREHAHRKAQFSRTESNIQL